MGTDYYIACKECKFYQELLKSSGEDLSEVHDFMEIHQGHECVWFDDYNDSVYDDTVGNEEYSQIEIPTKSSIFHSDVRMAWFDKELLFEALEKINILDFSPYSGVGSRCLSEIQSLISFPQMIARLEPWTLSEKNIEDSQFFKEAVNHINFSLAGVHEAIEDNEYILNISGHGDDEKEYLIINSKSKVNLFKFIKLFYKDTMKLNTYYFSSANKRGIYELKEPDGEVEQDWFINLIPDIIKRRSDD
ncbi:MAG: hypothetical protein JKY48_01365 [Flavobacteriales bacterium]|nr:hypothetical protein [Flavobacteriales bacterium]